MGKELSLAFPLQKAATCHYVLYILASVPGTAEWPQDHDMAEVSPVCISYCVCPIQFNLVFHSGELVVLHSGLAWARH